MILGAALNPKRDIFPQINAFAKAGFTYVDLALDFPLLAEFLDGPRLYQTLATRGLSFHGQTPVLLPFGSPYPDIRDEAVLEALKCINALAAAGAKTIVLHPDNAYHFLVEEDLIQWNLESFQRIVQKAPTGIQLLVENLSSGIFNNTGAFHQIFDSMPSLKLNLDVSHVFIGQNHGGSDLEKFLELPLAHMHLSDNDGRKDTHSPLGKGKVPWQQFIKTIIASGYEGTATIEIYSGSVDDVVASKRFLEPLIS